MKNNNSSFNWKYLASMILASIGFIIMAGAVGLLENGSISVFESLIVGIVGCVLTLVAIPISGDLENNKK